MLDGAQALGHVPLELSKLRCDLLLAGCHKWLGAYHPLGVAYCGKSQSAETIECLTGGLTRHRRPDDPLYRFVSDWEQGRRTRFGETVNLAPLFSCQGALQDISPRQIVQQHAQRLARAERLATQLVERGWRPLLPDGPLRSGILLLQARQKSLQRLPAETLRDRFRRMGIAVTCYHRGIVRISVPLD